MASYPPQDKNLKHSTDTSGGGGNKTAKSNRNVIVGAAKPLIGAGKAKVLTTSKSTQSSR